MLPVTNVPSGTLTLAGGSLVLASNLLVGTSSISTDKWRWRRQLDDYQQRPHRVPGRRGGAFTLSQGTMAVDNLLVTNTTASSFSMAACFKPGT